VDYIDCDPPFAAICSSYKPYLVTKEDLNHLVRDLNLCKKQAGLLGFRLKVWNVIRQDAAVYFFSNIQNKFEEKFLSTKRCGIL